MSRRHCYLAIWATVVLWLAGAWAHVMPEAELHDADCQEICCASGPLETATAER